jgi:hypothetical protein
MAPSKAPACIGPKPCASDATGRDRPEAVDQSFLKAANRIHLSAIAVVIDTESAETGVFFCAAVAWMEQDSLWGRQVRSVM